MPSVVYHSGAENCRGLLSGVSRKKKILAFINAPCNLLVECRLIAYPSQACSVSHSHTAEVATKGRSSFLGADAGSFQISTKIKPQTYWNIGSEDFLQCLRLRADALLLLSACDVIFVMVLSRLGQKSAYIRLKDSLKLLYVLH